MVLENGIYTMEPYEVMVLWQGSNLETPQGVSQAAVDEA